MYKLYSIECRAQAWPASQRNNRAQAWPASQRNNRAQAWPAQRHNSEIGVTFERAG